MTRRRAGLTAVTLALALGACSTPVDPEEAGNPPSSSTSRSSDATTSSSVRSPSASGTPARLDAALVRDLETVRRAHPEAEIAVALTPVGSSARPRVVGDPEPLVAWSTIKVPLALAVERSVAAQGDPTPTAGTATDPEADIEAALTVSDNAAAERLWQHLGAGSRAATAVEDQLRRGGDERTDVPPEVTVPGFSAFGQARWRLRDQARFTAALPCLAGSDPVTDAMGRVAGGQAWGLAGIDGVRSKGGWGSTPQGYVVRQLAILPGAKGETAAAVQVRTGTHEQGTRIMDEVAQVLWRHRERLPVGSCG